MNYDHKKSELEWEHNPADGPIGKLVVVLDDDMSESQKALSYGKFLHEGIKKGLEKPLSIRMTDSFNAATEALTRYYQEYCDNDVLATKEIYPEYKEEKMNKSGKINITDERGGLVEFGDLITPSVFCLAGDPEPCMKMEYTIIDSAYGYEVTINAVSLISGVTYNFQEDSLVIPLDCDIKIKEKKV